MIQLIRNANKMLVASANKHGNAIMKAAEAFTRVKPNAKKTRNHEGLPLVPEPWTISTAMIPDDVYAQLAPQIGAMALWTRAHGAAE